MRRIDTNARFDGDAVSLRILTLNDCSDTYVAWLEDPDVNRFLETRWRRQTISTVRAFVSEVLERDDTFLFAIVHKDTERHIGNIKIGPVNEWHAHADVSYFIGERSMWGRGLATDAIKTATSIGFQQLDLHRLQAGVYGANVASCRSLEKAGYQLEGRLRRQLRMDSGWDDHLYYGVVSEEWTQRLRES